MPIGIAVSGEASCRLAGENGDVMVAVEPDSELVRMFDEFGGSGKPRVGQIALAYDADRAVERAHDQFRWFALGWKVNAGQLRRDRAGPDRRRPAKAVLRMGRERAAPRAARAVI